MSDLNVGTSATMRGPLGYFWVLLALGSTGGLFYGQQQLQNVRLEMQGLTEQLSRSLQGNEQQTAAQKDATLRMDALESELSLWRQKGQEWEQGRDAWALGEAKFLITMAEQRLHYFGDLKAAKQQLEEATKLLETITAPALRPLKAKLVEALGLLTPLTPLDVEKTWVGLTQLRASIGALDVPVPVYVKRVEKNESSSISAGQTVTSSVEEGLGSNAPAVSQWKERFEASLHKLEGYVRLQHHSAGTPPPVLQMATLENAHANTLLLVDLAKWSVMTYRPLVYTESLMLLDQIILQTYGDKSDAAAVRAQIKALQAVAFPIAPSLSALIDVSSKTTLMTAPGGAV